MTRLRLLETFSAVRRRMVRTEKSRELFPRLNRPLLLSLSLMLDLLQRLLTRPQGMSQGGQLSAQQQLDTQPQAEITPGSSAQTAVSAGKYTTGDITVAGDSNLVPSNIKSGVSIFGVAGTAEVLDTPSAKIEITNESYSRMYVIYQKPGFLSWDAASFYGYGIEVVTVPVGGWIYAYSEDGFPYVESRNGCSLVGPGPNNEHNLVEVTATSGSVSFSVY